MNVVLNNPSHVRRNDLPQHVAQALEILAGRISVHVQRGEFAVAHRLVEQAERVMSGEIETDGEPSLADQIESVAPGQGVRIANRLEECAGVLTAEDLLALPTAQLIAALSAWQIGPHTIHAIRQLIPSLAADVFSRVGMLRRLREAAGMTLEQLAIRANLPRFLVSSIESGAMACPTQPATAMWRLLQGAFRAQANATRRAGGSDGRGPTDDRLGD